MALTAGDKAVWGDVNNLYRRVVSEKTRWGRSVSPTAATAGQIMQASQINTLRASLLDVVNNITAVSAARSTVQSATTAVQGKPISVPMLTTLRDAVNIMRSKFVVNNSWSSGFNSFSAGNNAKTTSKSQWDNGYGSVWAFSSGGGDFGHSGSKSFGFTTNNTSHNPCSSNCSAFFTCTTHFAAGFCTSYYNDPI